MGKQETYVQFLETAHWTLEKKDVRILTGLTWLWITFVYT